ncbi:hypothetical protein CkaCkLH20_12671 [Colletotrichum karsti]|uniref:Uncharacterized protein n=1 Tax=Colletotrichum karsti TaxID=1095194 RepID=A0A9P6HU79_9PEZI|nr:uncharacterized protein CkaCkLH20_12671 [Colletotrichum karsti]KAF9869872.1 hypothetical protein CkaCkLH20_12671 [Colletotrichum karsti]
MSYLEDPKPINPPCEVLRINKRFNGAQTTVDRIDLVTGHATPFYILHNNDEKAIAVLHADPRQQQMSDQALGTAKLHSLSSKIDVVFRGMEFKMKGNSAGMGHDFDYMGVPYSWTLSRMSGSHSTIFFKDGSGRLLARWKKHPDGRFSSSKTPPTFEVYVPPQSIDMDMVIVTGLASIGYWVKDKKDTYEAVGEILGAV